MLADADRRSAGLKLYNCSEVERRWNSCYITQTAAIRYTASRRWRKQKGNAGVKMTTQLDTSCPLVLGRLLHVTYIGRKVLVKLVVSCKSIYSTAHSRTRSRFKVGSSILPGKIMTSVAERSTHEDDSHNNEEAPAVSRTRESRSPSTSSTSPWMSSTSTS
jgi:hypothetical protein